MTTATAIVVALWLLPPPEDVPVVVSGEIDEVAGVDDNDEEVEGRSVAW
jgi:hypothetical protein